MQVMKGYPDRLTIEDFLAETPFCFFSQRLDELCPLHWHEFYELTYILSGNGVNTVNGTDLPIGPGTLFLLTPADFHEIRPLENEELRIYNFIFKETLIDPELRERLFRGDKRIACCDDAAQTRRAADFFRLMEEECAAAGRFGAIRIVRNLLDSLLVLLCRGEQEERPAQTARSPYHPGVQRALLHIQHHFREPLTLEDVARESRLSANYFSECFRQQTGIPFQRYVMDLRLEFARSLLKASPLPVTEVCYVSGFNTLTHFEKIYKRKFGQSPRVSRAASPAGGTRDSG
ncbi:AraC family transcriptional regulator [Cohnella zeiphila]|uniref:AraC family transcriptional regulator n=1 Tax=Cohnella zeiphila TaxID=2761120 RepID=A0A7X0SGC6_9BACL|nr:AraC family transcriptional regulator [Cohnella zeiphila]MBB6729485.1 AraC family transcriptional regulator [Cohnella zeiphila]